MGLQHFINFAKIASAVAASTPRVVHMSKKRVSTFPQLISNILRLSGFILFTPASFDPSTDSAYGTAA